MRLLLIYTLFAKDREAMAAAAETQLRPPPPPIIADTEIARDTWVEKEASKHDRFSKLISVTTETVNLGSGLITNEAVEACHTFSSDNERDVLAHAWTKLGNPGYPGGWHIAEKIWPKLINRSIHHSVSIPAASRTDLTKKYVDVQMYDLVRIYQFGVYSNWVRPVPRIDHALEFWLNRPFPDEGDLQSIAERDPSDPRITECSCEYVSGMAEVFERYWQ